MRACFLGLFISMMPVAAMAAAITNLTDKSQTLQRGISGQLESFTIEPGRTWRVPFDVKVHYGNRETMIHYYEEYAIWSEGQLAPQLSRYTAGGLNR